MSFTDFIDTWIWRKKGDSGSEAGSEAGSNKPLGRASRNGSASTQQAAGGKDSSKAMSAFGRYMYP